MHRALALLPILLAGCGRGSVTLDGTLADSTAASEVRVVGSEERVPIEGGAFRLGGLGRDSASVEFATSDGGVARMSLAGLGGGSVRLGGIWMEDGLAFPSVVEGANGPIVVNGLRLAPPDAVPADVNLSATILSLSGDGDALLVRPDDEGLPDLGIVITPRSVVRTLDGDAVDPAELEFGDSLRVSGLGQAGYVIASEITVSRSGSEEEARLDDGDDDDDSGSNDDASSGDGELGSGGEAITRAPESEPRGVFDRVFRRGGGEGKGGGEEKGKGKGKGRD